MTNDYYRVLGLDSDASQEDIRKAYRLYASKLHPDKHKGDQFFEERFKEIQEAYEVLSDPTRRAAYDRKRNGNDQQSTKANTTTRGKSKTTDRSGYSSSSTELSALQQKRRRDIIVGILALSLTVSLLTIFGDSGVHVPIAFFSLLVAIRQLFVFGVSFLPD